MEILGFIGAVIMGLSLGLIGGGGSILTVPILVYLFNVDPVLSTAYSLFIVGFTSLIGGFNHMRIGNVKWDMVLLFGLPAIASVYFTRAVIVPAIPDIIAQNDLFTLSKSAAMLLLFAVLMIASSIGMIKSKKSESTTSSISGKKRIALILGEGIFVGAITGLVGAGGGFLIIPALVLLAKLPMKKAVGTSLVIIAAKSLLGFTGDMQGDTAIDWDFLLLFSAIAVAGIVIGTLLTKRISGSKLKPVFGWFVLIMGIYVLSAELFL